jgi:hypothetical protein
MSIYGPCKLRVSSAKPESIEVTALDKGSYTLPTAISFVDLPNAWTYVRDRVDGASLWQVFEDNRMIAEGREKNGTRLASDAEVITDYLRIFLQMLDHRRENEDDK